MPASSSSETTRPAEHEERDIIVALEHAPLVKSVLELGGVGFRSGPDDENDALGLARLVLEDEIDAVALRTRLDQRLADESYKPLSVTRRSAGQAKGAGSVTAVLAVLYGYFRGRYAGWNPTMGRNRLVGSVTGGGGTVSHGGGPAPEATATRLRRRKASPSGRVTVGVLDTALVPHSWLAGSYLASQKDFLTARSELPYAAGHATFIAGLIRQQAPTATLRVSRVLEDDGTASSWDVATAIVELARSGVDILNLSLVCYTADSQPPLALATAVARVDPEVLIVACAGNHGDPSLPKLKDADHRMPAWPAALDNVVAVGSAEPVDGGDGAYELSHFTPWDAVWIDVVTRGEKLTSTYFTGAGVGGSPASRVDFEGWATWGGTSFSAALVAGAVAARADAKRIPVREAYHQIAGPVRTKAMAAYGRHVPPFLDV